MRTTTAAVCLALIGVAAASYAPAQTRTEEPGIGPDPRVSTGPIAPVLDGVGDQEIECTTDNETAKRFVNQGLSLIYAFNHDEAVRAFQEALRHDPDCALAYWGWAHARGPNLNKPMTADDVPEAWDAIQKAQSLKHKASQKERALIEALAQRYSDDPDADRVALDTAYAKAMKDLYAKYPDDAHIATFYAASLMDLNPWGYWTKDGQPRPNTKTAAAVLEKAIEDDPNNTGALHYYIHLVEEHFPERAEPASDQLTKLAPNAGHLVHMPSHIYMRLGRYSDAYEANKLAVLADEGYITACRNQGIYPLAYYPHNIHFQCWAAEREGHKEEAIRLARKVGNKALEAGNLGADFALQGAFVSMPLYALVRFGEWEQILKEPAPPAYVPYARGMYHYARGMAYLFTGKTREANAELEQLEKVRQMPEIQEEFVGFATAPTLLQIAASVLQGEMAAQAGNTDEALLHLEQAVRLEDSLTYNEPPDWPAPARHNLGAILLEAGRFAEAESVYWTDLKKNPNNGYALFGLHQALKAQDKHDAANEIQTRFNEVWATSDHQLTTSRF